MIHRRPVDPLYPLVLLLVVVVSLWWAVTARAQGGSPVEALPAWGTVPSPNGGYDTSNRLSDVEVLSPTDVWAVGSSGTGGYLDGHQPMIQHWDGSRWQVAALPPDAPAGDLQGVSASAPDNVWAVGGAGTGGGALVLRWDGSAWHQVPYTVPYTHWHWLYDVEALAPDDVWVVGEAETEYDYRMLLFHWDGSTWTDFSLNPTANGEKLVAVEARGPNDVWAVGYGGSYGERSVYVLHWDGSNWQQVADPVLDGFEALNELSIAPTGEVWLLGQVGEAHEPGVARWDGAAWQMLPLPAIAGVWTEIAHGIVGVGANEAWVVGRYALNGVFYGLTWYWNGSGSVGAG